MLNNDIEEQLGQGEPITVTTCMKCGKVVEPITRIVSIGFAGVALMGSKHERTMYLCPCAKEHK